MPKEVINITNNENEKRSEDRLSKVLCSINVGPKALIPLILPSDNSWMDITELVKRMHGLLAETKMANITRSSIINYCSFSLAGYSECVELAESSEQSPTEIRLNDFGHNVRTAAAIKLDFEFKNGFSLFPVLGSAASKSGKNRSPLVRSKILDFLERQHHAIREADIVEYLGIGRTLARQELYALAASGTVLYEAVNTRTGFVEVNYLQGTLSSGDVVLYLGYPRLTTKIVEVCQMLIERGESITKTSVLRMLTQDEPISTRSKEQQLSNKINSVLAHLSRHGFLERGKFEGGVNMSQASLTEKGKAVVDSFIRPIQRLVQGDTEIQPKVEEYLQTYAKNSINLYYPYSQTFKLKPGLIKETILTALGQSETALTAKQISEKTGLSTTTIHSNLEITGVVKEEIKGVFFYRIAS